MDWLLFSLWAASSVPPPAFDIFASCITSFPLIPLFLFWLSLVLFCHCLWSSSVWHSSYPVLLSRRSFLVLCESWCMRAAPSNWPLDVVSVEIWCLAFEWNGRKDAVVAHLNHCCWNRITVTTAISSDVVSQKESLKSFKGCYCSDLVIQSASGCQEFYVGNVNWF